MHAKKPLAHWRTRSAGAAQQAFTPAAPVNRDFFDDPYGEKHGYSWRSRALGRITDRVFDLPLSLRGQARRLSQRAAALPPRRVLVASVAAPGRAADLDRVLQALRQTHHRVETAVVPMMARGKFHNINMALQACNLAEFDWLLVTDDDVGFPPRFLDDFLFLAELAELKLCQPAHRFHSYAMFKLTYRTWNSLVRRTNFVECGPVTAFHRDVFPLVLPFPESRWAWGIDLHWAEQLRQAGHALGIVDATPMEHLKPVGNAYDFTKAIAEARGFLEDIRFDRAKRDVLRTLSARKSV